MMFKGYILLTLGVICFGNVSAITYYYMDDHCGGNIDISFDDEIRLKTTAFGDYPNDWTCTVTIMSSFDYEMMVYFKDLNIESSSSCTNDYFKMYDGSSKNSPTIGSRNKYCGFSTPSTVYTTTGNYLTLYFKSDSSFAYSGFDIVITEYETGLCYSWEHECDNGRCIDESLVCNGYNPCGDYSDCSVEIGLIVGPVIGGIAFFVAMVVIIIVVRRRRFAMRTVLAYPGGPVSTITSSSQSQSSAASGSYGVPGANFNTQYGYAAPVAPYQQMPTATGAAPPPYAPYKQQEMGMPAAH